MVSILPILNQILIIFLILYLKNQRFCTLIIKTNFINKYVTKIFFIIIKGHCMKSNLQRTMF